MFYLQLSQRDMPIKMIFIKEPLSQLMAFCKTCLEPLLKDAFIFRSSFKLQ